MFWQANREGNKSVMERSKNWYLLAILALLVLTAYVTTAFFIKIWPFGNAKPEGYVDLAPVSESIDKANEDKSGSAGALEGSYIVSDGTAYVCGDCSIVFPKGWLIVIDDDSKMAISTDLKNATNSILINSVNRLTVDSTDKNKILEEIGKSLGEGFAVDQVDTAKFFERTCLTVSGSAIRNGIKAGMVAMVIPSDRQMPGYWIIGFFDPKDMSSRDKVVESMASLKLEQAR